MPIQKNKLKENQPVSFRPGAVQRKRIQSLMEHRQQNQSAVINAALDLLWLVDIGKNDECLASIIDAGYIAK